jgi:HSP20 family protein
MPPADIVETERDLRVAVELPGIDMDALEISVSDGLLTIRGNKPQEKREGECVHCSERYFGSFRRSFRITGRVDPEKIDATYKEGILRVIIPKSERGSVKKIEVR